MSRYDLASELPAAQLKENLAHVLKTIETAAAGKQKVTLVAVSKTKSPACLQALYDANQRVFGENYVQEIVEKAPQLPDDIEWHFIGHLQSNKVKELLTDVPNLRLVQTVDSEKLAGKLDAGCVAYRQGRALEVFIQVNTSGEESKSGTEPGAPTVALAVYIAKACPHLQLKGLMTIGMLDYTSRPENFACLSECRAAIADALKVPAESLALSMGMSGDYESAIGMGATTVRVGSSLFGARYYPPKETTAEPPKHDTTPSQ